MKLLWPPLPGNIKSDIVRVILPRILLQPCHIACSILCYYIYKKIHNLHISPRSLQHRSGALLPLPTHHHFFYSFTLHICNYISKSIYYYHSLAYITSSNFCARFCLFVALYNHSFLHLCVLLYLQRVQWYLPPIHSVKITSFTFWAHSFLLHHFFITTVYPAFLHIHLQLW